VDEYHELFVLFLNGIISIWSLWTIWWCSDFYAYFVKVRSLGYNEWQVI